MSPFIKKTVATLTGALLTVIILGVAAVFVLSFLGIARFVPVLSNSMAPEMPKGSLAVMDSVPRASIAVGDVVVFTAPDGSHRRVIHRVQHLYGPDEASRINGWSADRAFLLTKGDNNPQADPWLLTLGDDVLWKQSTVIPALGWPAIWLADPTARVIAFMLGGALVASWALIAIWRHDTGDEADHNAIPVTPTGQEGISRR